ncbi:SAM-dependent methyltransferase [Thermoactinospora rubra]|uniref:SAM-dependent methyltransferase n=1 Tax=Thermoactinospora rubra TaxID=1088767 RepID=UPI000A11604D|nr:SAM-dependent methyltransferase [Thermoactinospora rubra]
MIEYNRGSPCIDITTPSVAWIHDYLLGSEAHFGSDRMAAEKLKVTIPGIAECLRDDRTFLSRAVKHLMVKAGIRQFIVIGSGLPTQGNVHDRPGAGSHERVRECFTGLRLLEPGVVDVHHRRPDWGTTGSATPTMFHGGVGQKPLLWALTG